MIFHFALLKFVILLRASSEENENKIFMSTYLNMRNEPYLYKSRLLVQEFQKIKEDGILSTRLDSKIHFSEINLLSLVCKFYVNPHPPDNDSDYFAIMIYHYRHLNFAETTATVCKISRPVITAETNDCYNYGYLVNSKWYIYFLISLMLSDFFQKQHQNQLL